MKLMQSPHDNLTTLAHRADYAAVGHPLFWLAVGWLHTLHYREAPGKDVQTGSVIFPSEHFIPDDLPSNFLAGSVSIESVEDAEFIAEVLVANVALPPYRDFRNDIRVYNPRSHDLYPIAGVSAFDTAMAWFANPTKEVPNAAILMPSRVHFAAPQGHHGH